MRNLKKGFTLVELLVVIAILAILASVSVIGYLKFTEKANVSNDTSMTTQMNNVLQANEASEGKNSTAYDAFLDLEESGLSIDSSEAYSDGYKYAWDKVTDRIVLLDENKNVVVGDAESYDSVNLFVPVDSASEISTYTSSVSAVANTTSTKLSTKKLDSTIIGSIFSIYLTTDYDEDSLTISSNVNVDLGKNTNVLNVTYNADVTSNVYVRTNGGELNISSKTGSAKITLLGSSNVTTISSSVEINVESTISIQLGILDTTPNITIASNSNVSTLAFNTTSIVSTENIKVESNTITSVVATEGSGVTESYIISDSNSSEESVDEGLKEASSLFTNGGYGTKANPYLISTIDELQEFSYSKTSTSNFQKYFVGKKIFIKFNNDIIAESKISSIQISNIDLIIDLAGYTLNVSFNTNLFYIGKYSSSEYLTKLTINDSAGTGQIIGCGKHISSSISIFQLYAKTKGEAELIINGGNFTLNYDGSNSDPTACIILVDSGNSNSTYNNINICIINGGSFFTNVSNCPTIYLTSKRGNSTINIYGGKFDTFTTGYLLLNIDDNYSSDGPFYINVYGGQYVGFDPSNTTDENIKVADGYEVSNETDSNGIITYEVKKSS